MEKLHQLIARIFAWPRPFKRATMLAYDILAVVVAAYFAAWLTKVSLLSPVGVLLTALATLGINSGLKLYSSVTRHVSLSIILISILAAVFSTLSLAIIENIIQDLNYSTKTAIVYCLLIYSMISGSRLLVRSYYSYRSSTEKENIIIYGAGSAGQQLVASLANGKEFHPVAFVDDNTEKHATYLHGLRVYSHNDISKLIELHQAKKILLALPAIKRKTRQDIINRLEKYKIVVQSIPGMADIVSGKMKIDQVQDVSIDDLLGRDAVPPKPELIGKNIKDKTVFVSGAGGSIGSELCRQIVRQQPGKLLLFDISEYALYLIHKELEELKKELKFTVELIPLLGSVRDTKQLSGIFNRFAVNTIYHAAAYKHVPLVEYNVIQGVKNNIVGTKKLCEIAIQTGVKNFVLISTDKAVRPTNIMGATKRFAELILQAFANTQSKTIFTMVRFGNVLGSSGSVVPLFKDQIKNGGPVTVTHKDITRYFMTIPEAAQLVIQAGAMGKGGDVFVLDMGESVKISELAEKLIHLMGFDIKSKDNPDGEIEIQYTGLRPGEKLYEELLIGSNVKGTAHPRIMTAEEVSLDYEKLDQIIQQLLDACTAFDFQKIQKLIIDAPTGYEPTSELCDYLIDTKQEASSKTNILGFPKN